MSQKLYVIKSCPTALPSCQNSVFCIQLGKWSRSLLLLGWWSCLWLHWAFSWEYFWGSGTQDSPLPLTISTPKRPWQQTPGSVPRSEGGSSQTPSLVCGRHFITHYEGHRQSIHSHISLFIFAGTF